MIGKPTLLLESEVEAKTQVWSDRLKAQIGDEPASKQIRKDAEEYRVKAELMQRQADAAAAAARAAEADAAEARDKAAAADAAEAIRTRLADSIAADEARAADWEKKDAAKEAHWDITQTNRE